MNGVAWRPPYGQALLLLALAGVATWLLLLHGSWPAWQAPDRMRAAAALALGGAWLLLCGGIGWRQLRLHRRATRDAHWRVAYASQSGFAAELAQQTAQSLRAAGIDAEALPLASLDASALAASQRLLVVASTTGAGDAPDGVAGFVRTVLETQPDLRGLHYGMLALGDRDYEDFCAFGRRLDAWLRGCGAQSLFDRVEVDDGDAAALRHWQHHLGVLAGRTDLPDWTPPRYADWRLVARRELNPGSLGGGCFHLELQPEDGSLPQWRAGDLVEVGPCNPPADVDALLARLGLDGAARVRHAHEDVVLRDVLARSALAGIDVQHAQSAQALVDRVQDLPHREYSIASVPADGALHLLVRRMQRADGTPGLGSGWLTQHLEVGGRVRLRIRTNANFHAPDDARPLILVGNGTGIAGLRALLRERIGAGHLRNWLLFGEREAARDFHYADELLRWRESGAIERIDTAFSRDQSDRVYVQHRLADEAARLRQWIEAGASVYVCGSLEGMAPGVHAVLVDVLGAPVVERMQAEGRYRRDVY